MNKILNTKEMLAQQFFMAIQDDDEAIQSIDARLKQGEGGPFARDTDAGEVSHMIANARFAVTLGSDGEFDMAQNMLDSCLLRIEAREERLPKDLRAGPHLRQIETKLASFLQRAHG